MSPPVARIAALLLLLALTLMGCRREADPDPGGDPVAAVQAQIQALRDDDLLRYTRLSLPPDLQARLESQWSARMAAASAPDDEARAEFAQMMTRLTAPDAEQALYDAFERKIKPLEAEIAGQWPMMQATAGIFLKAAVEANDTLDSAEKDHASAVIAALLAWLQPDRLIDRSRARQAIAELTRTARAMDFVDLDQMRALPFEPALQKASLAFAGLKRIGVIYGLDANAMLGQATVTLRGIEGTAATVTISYPLLGQTIAFELPMVEREGRWYGANAVRQAEQELADAVIE